MSNTVLLEVLSQPNFKSGLIVAPCLSGKTYALCDKAIRKALEGEFVLLVTLNRATAYGVGGVHETIQSQLEDDNIKYRHSAKSDIYQIGQGKLKVVSEDFVLEGSDFTPNTVIYTDSIPYPHQRHVGETGTSVIRCTSHYQLADHKKLGSINGDVIIRRNLTGEEVNMGVQLPPSVGGFYEKGVERDGLSYAINQYGYFKIEVIVPSKMLVEQNELYMKYVEGLNPLDKTRMMCTDFAECMRVIKSVQSAKEERDNQPNLEQRVASIEETLKRIETMMKEKQGF